MLESYYVPGAMLHVGDTENEMYSLCLKGAYIVAEKTKK